MKRRKCRHDRLRGIYGDEIIHRGYNRSECLDCGKLFPELPDTRYPSVTECPSCGGTGEHSDWEFLPRCPTCKGSGEVPADDDSYSSVTEEPDGP